MLCYNLRHPWITWAHKISIWHIYKFLFLIHSFKTYLLGTDCVPRSVLVAGKAGMNKGDQYPVLKVLIVYWGQFINKWTGKNISEKSAVEGINVVLWEGRAEDRFWMGHYWDTAARLKPGRRKWTCHGEHLGNIIPGGEEQVQSPWGWKDLEGKGNLKAPVRWGGRADEGWIMLGFVYSILARSSGFTVHEVGGCWKFQQGGGISWLIF